MWPDHRRPLRGSHRSTRVNPLFAFVSAVHFQAGLDRLGAAARRGGRDVRLRTAVLPHFGHHPSALAAKQSHTACCLDPVVQGSGGLVHKDFTEVDDWELLRDESTGKCSWDKIFKKY